ncbi:MAG: helix-hairpin-helix domain-containing protein [Bacteroidales bacterium]
MFKMTRGERIGALLLLCALFILILTRLFVLPVLTTREPLSHIDSLHILQFTRLKDSLRDHRVKTRLSYDRKEINYTLFDFDPNTADSSVLINLGIRSYVVSNILRYRKKGGEFRTKNSLSRIYGLSQTKYSELEPYIEIDTARFIKPPTKRDTTKRYKFDEVTPIDINRCDTALLKRIPGIGVGYANMIVQYRERLGGFVRADQLKEISSIPDSIVNFLISEWVVIEEPEIRRLDINKSGIDRLRYHPYINFYQAKAMIELRKKRGSIKSISELAMLEEFSQEDLDRLSDYILFDN